MKRAPIPVEFSGELLWIEAADRLTGLRTPPVAERDDLSGRNSRPVAGAGCSGFQRDQREVFAKVSWPIERLLKQLF